MMTTRTLKQQLVAFTLAVLIVSLLLGGLRFIPLTEAQQSQPLTWAAWTKLSNSSAVSDFTTTATTQSYKLANQPNVSLAVYSSTGVTAYTIVLETAPFDISGASWSQVTTVDFTDDGSVAAPKWQQISIPGCYGLVRARITALTPGAGNVQLYLCA